MKSVIKKIKVDKKIKFSSSYDILQRYNQSSNI